MATQKRRKPKVKRSITKGLWVPQEILSISPDQLSWLGKMVCAKFGSYGAKGCYESLRTMARFFGVSDRQMDFTVAQIRSLHLTYSIKLRGRSTCYWLRCSPKVQAAERLFYRGRSKRNPGYDRRKYCAGVAQKTAPVPAQETAPDLYSTNKTTTAASPSPANGQAQRREKAEAVAQSKTQSHIWAEIVRHLPFVSVLDGEVKTHQLTAIARFKDKAEELVQGGMSADNAVKKVLGKKYVKAREESL